MSYERPPNAITLTSANHVVGAVNTVMVAAPGPGGAIRVVGGMLSPNRASTGVLDYFLFETGSGLIFYAVGGLSVGGSSIAYVEIPEPGYQMAANESLTAQALSSIASGASRLTIYYYIDTL